MQTNLSADADVFDPATTLGSRLADAREAAGLDVEDLAARLGVKPRTIRAWEENRAEPRANRISMLAGLTSVSLRWLLTGMGKGPSGAPRAGDRDLIEELGLLRRDAVRITDRLRFVEARLKARLGEDA